MEVRPHLIWINLFITGHWNSGNWIGETIPKWSYGLITAWWTTIDYPDICNKICIYIQVYQPLSNKCRVSTGLANALFIIPSLRLVLSGSWIFIRAWIYLRGNDCTSQNTPGTYIKTIAFAISIHVSIYTCIDIKCCLYTWIRLEYIYMYNFLYGMIIWSWSKHGMCLRLFLGLLGGIDQMNDRCFLTLTHVISDIYGILFKLHPSNWNNAQLYQGSDKGGGVVQRILIGTRHKA